MIKRCIFKFSKILNVPILLSFWWFRWLVFVLSWTSPAYPYRSLSYGMDGEMQLEIAYIWIGLTSNKHFGHCSCSPSIRNSENPMKDICQFRAAFSTWAVFGSSLSDSATPHFAATSATREEQNLQILWVCIWVVEYFRYATFEKGGFCIIGNWLPFQLKRLGYNAYVMYSYVKAMYSSCMWDVQ